MNGSVLSETDVESYVPKGASFFSQQAKANEAT